MRYQPSQQLDPRASFYIDLYDIAHLIEHLLGPVLVPPEAGLYLPNQLEPVLKQGVQYWYEKTTMLEAGTPGHLTSHRINMNLHTAQNGTLYGGEVMTPHAQTKPWGYYSYEYIPVGNVEEAILSPWDVVNVNPMVDSRSKHTVLPRHLAAVAAITPSVPMQGIKIAIALITSELDNTRAYIRRPPATIEEVILPFINQTYQNLDHIRKDRWFQDMFTSIFDASLQYISSARSVFRDNPYSIFSFKQHDAYQLRIDQLGDHRIMEWEQITQDPEYQRWQRARNNGEWDRHVSVQDEMATNAYANFQPGNPYL